MTYELMGVPSELSEHQRQLDLLYGGTVRHLDRYVNPRLVLKYECSHCGDFYAAPRYLLTNDKHDCAIKVAVGERNRARAKAKKQVAKKELSEEQIKELIRLYQYGYSQSAIAMRFEISRYIVKKHLKEGGVI
jgi:hypothetical protein